VKYISIEGSESFIERVVENWSSIKPHLVDFEEVRICESEYLKVDAKLDIDGEAIIICDYPNPENIKALKSLIKAQSEVRKDYRNQIVLMIKIQIGHIQKLSEMNESFEFVEEIYSKFMDNFLVALCMSLEKILALDRLGIEERSILERMEDMKNPFKEKLKSLEKDKLYIVIMDNLWRINLGLELPDFIYSSGVDVEGLKNMFREVLNALRTKDIKSWSTAAQAITSFTLKIFGIELNETKPPERKGTYIL
jgi:hypothetical protein